MRLNSGVCVLTTGSSIAPMFYSKIRDLVACCLDVYCCCRVLEVAIIASMV